MSETKPSTAALRAAEALCEQELLDAPIGTLCEPDRSQIAHIIDRETNLAELLADSKKLREPATCNAGHKSNLPLALWDCPVCTQLLRDKLQQAKELAEKIFKTGKRVSTLLCEEEIGAHEAALNELISLFKEYNPADTNSPEVRRARGAM